MDATRTLNNITYEDLVRLNRDKDRFVLIATSYLNDRALAEDIFQDGLLYMMEHRDEIQVANLKWYFSRIIMNKCLYLLRQRQNQTRIRDSMRDAAIIAENISILSDKTSEGTIFNADLSGRLEECRKALDGQAYDIFIDAKVNGLSYKDIADRYKISQRHVATEMQRALAVFRKVFRDYWFVIALLTYL